MSPLTSESSYDGAKLIVLLIWIRCESFWVKFHKRVSSSYFSIKIETKWVMAHTRITWNVVNWVCAYFSLTRSFIEQIFIESSWCAKHCAICWGRKVITIKKSIKPRSSSSRKPKEIFKNEKNEFLFISIHFILLFKNYFISSFYPL